MSSDHTNDDADEDKRTNHTKEKNIASIQAALTYPC